MTDMPNYVQYEQDASVINAGGTGPALSYAEWAVCPSAYTALAKALATTALLKRACRFYADPKRYEGPNRRVTVADEFQPTDLDYILDVTRDGGNIASKALRGIR